ncbi:CPBP family intramembrane metalloprotease [Gottschalkiaceae bacterium SANA]|nr:CPBP family intramembrane metalloprotease [Gottschalkiaceae bacterium SANA]
MKKSCVVMAIGIMACGILYGIEQGIHVDYLTQSLVKIFLFLVIPLGFIRAEREERNMTVNRQRGARKNGWWHAILLGIFSFAAVLGGYYLLRSFIDFPHIVEDLQTRLKVSQMNYLLIGAYVVFFNSFLEEVFFRGFIFARLYRNGQRVWAYLLSSLLFALYHISIFKTWFTWPMMVLALCGLAIGGLIFCWLNRKTLRIYHSWIAHIFADLAIIWIGYTLFF